MYKKNNLPNRREALKMGAMFAAVTALGTTFIPTLISAQETSKKIKIFDVLKMGAAGDGKTLDTAVIQKAIDNAAAAGRNAQVLLRGGNKYLTGTLKLKSGIDFHLADDAELIASTNQADYIGDGLITAFGAKGLQLTGTGSINGQALKFMTHFDEEFEWWRPASWRPKLFILTACNDLLIRDITFGQSPHWGLHMVGCENVLVENLKIRNHLDLPNCDGIDPDHCRNVEIRNCDIVCGDDAIVIKATREGMKYGATYNISVSDCVIETQDSGVKIGTETTQDISKVLFERCEIKSSCRGLTIQLRDEGNVEDIIFRDINFVSRYHSDPWWGRGEAISLTAIPRTPETKTGRINNVLIQNIRGKAENSVRISGTLESRIQNVSLDNVAVTLDRWTKYKGGLFDNRPTKAYQDIEPHGNPGYSIRNADNISLKNCSIDWGQNLPDYFTYALEAESVTNLKLSEFKGKAAHPDLCEDMNIN